MSNTTPSPYMSLPVPVTSVDPGPDWANNINASLSIIDQHNHTAGQGALIPPSALNINTDLTFQGNSATNLKSVVFTAQTTYTTRQAVYVSGVDLYYNDGSGNAVRITQSGTVAGSTGTITGLPSGTASASYQSGSGTFQFQSATNTPANISGASFLLSQQTTSPNFITLASPSSLAAAYTITMPAATPAAISILRMDTSGNVSNNLIADGTTITVSSNQLQVVSGGIGTTQLANLAVTAAKIANATITTTQISASAGILGSQLANNPTFGGNTIGVSAIPDTITAYSDTYALNGTQQNCFALGYAAGGRGYRIVSGIVDASGANSVRTFEGFTVTHSTTGVYGVNITISDSQSKNIIGCASIYNGTGFIAVVTNSSTFQVNTYNTSAAAANLSFSFIAIVSA